MTVTDFIKFTCPTGSGKDCLGQVDNFNIDCIGQADTCGVFLTVDAQGKLKMIKLPDFEFSVRNEIDGTKTPIFHFCGNESVAEGLQQFIECIAPPTEFADSDSVCFTGDGTEASPIQGTAVQVDLNIDQSDSNNIVLTVEQKDGTVEQTCLSRVFKNSTYGYYTQCGNDIVPINFRLAASSDVNKPCDMVLIDHNGVESDSFPVVDFVKSCLLDGEGTQNVVISDPDLKLAVQKCVLDLLLPDGIDLFNLDGKQIQSGDSVDLELNLAGNILQLLCNGQVIATQDVSSFLAHIEVTDFEILNPSAGVYIFRITESNGDQHEAPLGDIICEYLQTLGVVTPTDGSTLFGLDETGNCRRYSLGTVWQYVVDKIFTDSTLLGQAGIDCANSFITFYTNSGNLVKATIEDIITACAPAQTTSSMIQVVTSGNLIAQHDDGDGNVTDIFETVTSLVDNGDNTYTYTNEEGTQTVIQTEACKYTEDVTLAANTPYTVNHNLNNDFTTLDAYDLSTGQHVGICSDALIGDLNNMQVESTVAGTFRVIVRC